MPYPWNSYLGDWGFLELVVPRIPWGPFQSGIRFFQRIGYPEKSTFFQGFTLISAFEIRKGTRLILKILVLKEKVKNL